VLPAAASTQLRNWPSRSQLRRSVLAAAHDARDQLCTSTVQHGAPRQAVIADSTLVLNRRCCLMRPGATQYLRVCARARRYAQSPCRGRQLLECLALQGIDQGIRRCAQRQQSRSRRDRLVSSCGAHCCQWSPPASARRLDICKKAGSLELLICAYTQRRRLHEVMLRLSAHAFGALTTHAGLAAPDLLFGLPNITLACRCPCREYALHLCPLSEPSKRRAAAHIASFR